MCAIRHVLCHVSCTMYCIIPCSVPCNAPRNVLCGVPCKFNMCHVPCAMYCQYVPCTMDNAPCSYVSSPDGLSASRPCLKHGNSTFPIRKIVVQSHALVVWWSDVGLVRGVATSGVGSGAEGKDGDMHRNHTDTGVRAYHQSAVVFAPFARWQ